jgi:hypothetical protein
VQSKLQSTAAFATVDTFDAASSTPSLSQLAAYHAVLVYSQSDFADASLLGDRLADYHDQGGGVVVAFGANYGSGGNRRLQGAYGSAGNGYALLDYAQGVEEGSPSSGLNVLEPQSPLMVGVASLSAIEAWHSTAPPIAGLAVVVARWQGGGQEPLVLRGMRGERTLVELNLHPPSSSAYSQGWTGDGAKLMRNTLKYSRCLRCGSGRYAAAGDDFGVLGHLTAWQCWHLSGRRRKWAGHRRDYDD